MARYVLGSAALLATITLVVRGARAARARLVPDGSLPLECLIVILLSVACVTIVSELLGTVGLFHVVPLSISFAAAGLGLARIAPAPPARRQVSNGTSVTRDYRGELLRGRRGDRRVGDGNRPRTSQRRDRSRFGLVPPAHCGALRAIRLDLGPAHDRHHLARGLLSGGREVIHAIGMEFLGTDALSRTLSFGWLIVALLAAWCIGARWGVGPLTLWAAAVLFATPQLVRVDAGKALNDMAVIALVLGTIANLVTCAPAHGAWLAHGSLIVAGIAAGSAVGTKWTALAPVAALTIGIPFLIRPGRVPRLPSVARGLVRYRRILVRPEPDPRRVADPAAAHRHRPASFHAHSGGAADVLDRRASRRLRRVARPISPGPPARLRPGVVGHAGARPRRLLVACVANRERTVWITTFVGAATVVSYLFVEQAFSIAEWSATARFTAPGIALGADQFRSRGPRRSPVRSSSPLRSSAPPSS